MFRSELIRAFWNRSFLFALILGLLSLTQGYFEYIDGPSPSDPGYQDYLASLPPFYNNAYDALIWAEKGVLWFAYPGHQARNGGLAAQAVPIQRVYRSGMYLYQDLIVLREWFFYLFDFNYIGGAVSFINSGFHH
ncbi:MAG: hypothetical protein OEZ02_02960 [Anaerolineae bacterium]|nr:hypothetical protein [Anaerolineae bacterium]